MSAPEILVFIYLCRINCILHKTYHMTAVSSKGIISASHRLKGIIKKTSLEKSISLSEKYEAEIYLKREDLQVVRSYKIRGAYNKISQLTEDERANGIVCASAGNHAQGFAHSCSLLNCKGYVYMPSTTPKQKYKQVKRLGKENVEIILTGDTYDDAYLAANQYAQDKGAVFVPAFDDPLIIEGQGTVAKEICEDLSDIDLGRIPWSCRRRQYRRLPGRGRHRSG